MDGCVFCEIAQGRREAHILYEDDEHISFLDRYPVVPGHTLVIPKAHYSTILEMDPAAAGGLFGLVPRLVPSILHVTGTAAFNVGQNNGDAAKQVVPHVHVHIIPRRTGDRINWNARAIHDREKFSNMADAVRRHMRNSRSAP